MSKQLYITASCSISKNGVTKNGETLFEDGVPDIATFLHDVYKHFGLSYARFYKMDNLSKLGWLTSELLLKDSFAAADHLPAETGIVLMNANSSLDSDLKYMASVADIPSPALFVYTLPNIMIGEICIRNKFKGEAAFFVSEKFDAEFIKQYVTVLFNGSNLQRCICGWVDVMGDDYKAVLFLIERTESDFIFNMDNMNKVFDKQHII